MVWSWVILLSIFGQIGAAGVNLEMAAHNSNPLTANTWGVCLAPL
jgi:hypothetical protein